LIEIEQVSHENQAEAELFLAKHEDASQFLINNLKEHGANLTDHHNSGNFKVIFQDNLIKAVFCLSRRGNLILQSDDDFSEMIIRDCENEEILLKGFIGEWDSVEPVYKYFQKIKPCYKPIYESQEILYSYEFKLNDAYLFYDQRVRLLNKSDFNQWLEQDKAYMYELNIPDDLELKQKKVDFERRVLSQSLWGMFDGSNLVSQVGLNSKGERIGQIGGVFTPPKFRRKGYAKTIMSHVLKDCRDLHGHNKSILFTGKTDVPAQKLYESIGYKQVGLFALILGG
jgi:ribosomal protein S18 acetylase RimI-like enzyme